MRLNRKNYDVPQVLFRMLERLQDIIDLIGNTPGSTLEETWGVKPTARKNLFNKWVEIVQSEIDTTGNHINVANLINDYKAQNNL